jgi:hypothetical protein
MMIDEEIEKPLLDLGLVKGYADYIKQYYRLPSMDLHLIWVYYEDGRCSVPNDLYGMDDSIVTSVGTRSFNTVSDAIPYLKYLIKKHKELLVRLKKREIEKDFKNE